MKNQVGEGKRVTVTAPTGGVTSGDPVLIDSLFGVAMSTESAGDPLVIATEGVFTLAKVDGTAVTQGQTIYWDGDNSECTPTPAVGLFSVGVAVAAAGSGATTCQVRLHGNVDSSSPITPAHLAVLDSVVGVPFVIECDATAASASIVIFNANAPYKFRVLDVSVQCTATNSSGTAQLESESATSITDAIVCDTADGINRATTIDRSTGLVPAGGSLGVAKNAAGDGGFVYVLAVRVA